MGNVSPMSWFISLFCNIPQAVSKRYWRILKIFWRKKKHLETCSDKGVFKCLQTGEMLLLEIMQAGMFGRTRTTIKPFQGRRKNSARYPSLTFFCHRWFCLVSTSYWIWIGWNFKRTHGLKRSGSFGGNKRQLLLFRHYDLWFSRAAAHGNIFFQICLLTSNRQRQCCFSLVVAEKRVGFEAVSKNKNQGHHQSWTVIWVHLNKAVPQL